MASVPVFAGRAEEFLRRFTFEPSLNSEGFGSGYQGQGVKTILPSSAQAKMESQCQVWNHKMFGQDSSTAG